MSEQKPYEQTWERNGVFYYWANWCPFRYRAIRCYPIQQALFHVFLEGEEPR